MGDFVRHDRHGRVSRLVLDRPRQMNAISTGLLEELAEEVRIASSDRGTGVIVLSAAGPAFCAGADLVEAEQVSPEPSAFREWLYRWQSTFRGLAEAPKPVIAAVQGIALAGGLELMLACDVVVASAEARFGDAHIRYGLVPGGGGSQRLRDAVGTRWARWLMYSGDVIDAEHAYRIGLVQHVLPADLFDEAVLDLATAMASRSAPALAFMKRMTRPASVTDEGLDLEVEAAVSVVGGPDAAEGLAAFLAKRQPSFPSASGGSPRGR